MSAPGTIATRAVHQYRRRDILTYVGLRQLLANASARRNRWAEEVASALVLERGSGAYHAVPTFKEINPDGSVVFRDLMMPPPHEALAEASLLAHCAEAGGDFGPHANVYSYRLSSNDEVRGMFKPYFAGFAERQAAIHAACMADPAAIVLQTDIRKFYPSISRTVAQAAWARACDHARLQPPQRELGEKFLRDHAKAGIGQEAVLTGPMFSHLIGNLVFREIDDHFGSLPRTRYFRYVDDIAFVGRAAEVKECELLLMERLSMLALQLHPEKRMEVSAARWIAGASVIAEEEAPSWKTFIGRMKQLLMLYPDTRPVLNDEFLRAGIRIRPLDYSEAQQERPYLQRIGILMQRTWFRRKMRSIRIREIIDEGLALRARYTASFFKVVGRVDGLEGIERKRGIQQLRFLTSRLIYLAAPDRLGEIEDAISGITEMAMIATAYGCVRTGNVTPLLRFGPAAAQAAAQPLKALGSGLHCKASEWSHEAIQAYAILRLNQVDLGLPPPNLPRTPIVQFCEWDPTSAALLDAVDPYFRELASVHGLDRAGFNAWAVETAFDRDDDLVFDMQAVVQHSS